MLSKERILDELIANVMMHLLMSKSEDEALEWRQMLYTYQDMRAKLAQEVI